MKSFYLSLARYERAVILEHLASGRLDSVPMWSKAWIARFQRWNRCTRLAHQTRRQLLVSVHAVAFGPTEAKTFARILGIA